MQISIFPDGSFRCLALHIKKCCLLCFIPRFSSQSEWFRANKKGKFNWDFLDHKDLLLEEVNMNYTLINYSGLSNFGISSNSF